MLCWSSMNIAARHACSASATARVARCPQLVDCSLTSLQFEASDASGGRVSRRVRYRSQLRNYFTKICEVTKHKNVEYCRVGTEV